MVSAFKALTFLQSSVRIIIKTRKDFGTNRKTIRAENIFGILFLDQIPHETLRYIRIMVSLSGKSGIQCFSRVNLCYLGSTQNSETLDC